MKHFSKHALIPYIAPSVLVLIWDVSIRFQWLPESLIASPWDTLIALWELTKGGDIFKHGLISVFRLGAGFLIGFVGGVCVGSLIGVSRRVELFTALTVQLLAPVPVIAWIPLLIVIFGIDGSRIALISIGIFFMVYFATLAGIRDTDVNLIELSRVYKKSPFQLWQHILLPSASVMILATARQALQVGWILLLAAEVISSESGLGWLIWDSRNFARPDDMIVGMIAVGVLGKLTDIGCERCQRMVLSWRKEFAGV